jgi:D-beta-D-heptose 7-phosphate kinase/D-beta-D-heptose 1-phosphate adenosyltransferase
MDLERLKNTRILVVGDIMLDTYFKGSVKRISPEAPVPVVHVNSQFDTLGGAANVCRNLCNIGCNVHLIGCIGKDYKGDTIKQKLKSLNIKHSLVVTDYPTVNKIRVIGNHQQIVRVDFEAEKMILSSQQQIEINQIISERIAIVDCVIISDYGKGFCTEEICQNAIETANKQNKIIIVDPKGVEWKKYTQATIVTPNLRELSDVLGKEISNNDGAINTAAEQILQKYNLKNILITRSEQGMSLVSENAKEHIPTEAKEVFDVSGAGDTVVAVLAASLSAQFPLMESVFLSNKAAGIVVEKEGTVPVSYKEIEQAVSEQTVSSKIITQENLLHILTDLRSKNKRIVFTNGVFDVIHRGHIYYLQKAKQLGDILIIGLNTDSSVKRLKGETRPINNEVDRAFVLSAFEFVDYVVLFSEDTPYNLIKTIQPDVLAKGADYKIENVVGREFTKETVLIDFQEGYSSTDIFNRTYKYKNS